MKILELTWRAINKQKDELVTPTGFSLGIIIYNRMMYHENTYDAHIDGRFSAHKTKSEAMEWVEKTIGVIGEGCE